MDAVVNSALEEICCGAAEGLNLSDLWAKIGPTLAARGLPICPNLKRAVWENLAEIPELKLVACNGASSKLAEALLNYTAEECEQMDVKIVAPEAMRRSFLGLYDVGTWLTFWYRIGVSGRLNGDRNSSYTEGIIREKSRGRCLH